MIRSTYFEGIPTVGGGLPNGGSMNWGPVSNPGSDQVTLAVITTIRSSSGCVATPGAGWVSLGSVQVQSKKPQENWLGTTTEYAVTTIFLGVGSVGNLTATFSTSGYYGASISRYTGVDLSSPIMDFDITARQFSGSTDFDWSPSFADTLSVSGLGVPILLLDNGDFFARDASPRYPTETRRIPFYGIRDGRELLTALNGQTLTMTPAIYTRGSSRAALVMLRPVADPHCTIFVGTVGCTVASAGVSLSVASNSFPDALSNYKIDFFADTTSGTTPGPGLLSGGAVPLGPMNPGESINYAISRLDGAHIDGSCVMRATDTAFGLTWDLTVQCPANPWGYNLSFGQRSGL